MRSVNRQTVACPEILTGPESRQSQYELVEYFMLPKNERRQLRPPINREIPFHETVKDSLLNLFSGKCAFCESPIAGSLEIDIEHFRPLANAQNLSQKKQSSDHYGWFAYEWRNLFPACARCNRTKRSFFPVRGPRANILSAWDDAERDEKTLLLNPCKDKPYKHLEFDWDGNVFGKTEIGKYTIKTVGLNRPDLISARSEHFSTLRRSVSEIYQLSSHPYSERIFSPLEKHLKDDSPFSGCCLILLYQAICGTTKSEGLTPPSFEKFAKRFPQFFKNMDSENWLTLAPQSQ
ncbi:MAG: HNH endonuclease [Marinobacter sp.]|nr:HNH endonuclease [Marinobacter sp.]